MTFWEHIDELRGSLIRMAIAIVVCAIVVFFFKEAMFRVILAPQEDNFVTYRLLSQANLLLFPASASTPDVFHVQLINTGLAHQFLLHVKASLYVGVLLTSPYLIYQLFHFVAPALYAHERRYALRLVGCGYLLFLSGVLISYFLIFPLIFRFLGTYQVSQAVANTITIDSYMDSLMSISLAMGVLFEIPAICWILGCTGLIDAAMMSRYRRHVIVALLVVAAIITPTADVFTLSIVALPMWLLYELGILIVKKSGKRGDKLMEEQTLL